MSELLWINQQMNLENTALSIRIYDKDYNFRAEVTSLRRWILSDIIWISSMPRLKGVSKMNVTVSDINW